MSFTPEQIAALSAKLDGSHVKTRAQAGRQLSYIEAWQCIAEANRIFGFDGWDRETVECRMVTERECKIGKGQWEKDGWRVGYIAKVRVTVRPNIVREGTGYGSGIDADLGAAHESAIKEAESDAMKRALMTFGNPFGLALYDKAQENVEHANGNGHAAQKPKTDSDSPDIADARTRYGRILKQIHAASHPGTVDNVVKDAKGDIEFIRKVVGEEAALKLMSAVEERIRDLEGARLQ